MAETNDLTEKAVIKVLKRKLENSARQLLKKIMYEFVQKSKQPTLKEIVLRLEDRYCSEYQPEVASAKLSMYKKGKNQPYQIMEGDIHELCHLAVRGEDVTDQAEWIKNKETAVFKQAITDDDRKLINRENQSRILSNLPELTVSQMVDILIKTYSESKAYTTASDLKFEHRIGDSEYLQKVEDKEDEDEEDDDDDDDEDDEYEEGDYDEDENFEGLGEDQIKAELFARYKSRKNQQNQRENEGNHNDTYHNGNYQNGFNGNFDRPRNFVTAEMVNTDVGACFKCNSQNHKFTEKEKCVYGEYKLFQKPCFTCGVGGHHFTNCIRNRQPHGESSRQNRQDQGDPNQQKYKDFTKSIPEEQEYDWEMPLPKKRNNELPPLFPW